ncbi:MAG: hypothetical protein HYV52_02235 [Parcubacteria group bacterium]|nr:hypothetical protein [Parcubacteria group bacterium]
MIPNILINLSRLGFLIFLIFQALNLKGILNFQPTFSWEGLITTSLFIWFSVEFIHYYLKNRNLRSLSSFVFVLGFIPTSVDFFGDILHFYDRFYWYDRAAHFSAASSLAILALIILSNLRKKNYFNWSLVMLLFIVFSVTLIGGVFYEIEEYLEDRLYWSRQLRLGDGPDTVEDIMFDAFGGLFVTWTAFIYQKVKNARKNSSAS